MKRKDPPSADSRDKAGTGAMRMLLATLFWIAVAIALFFYFKSFDH
jgi:hypothetical protein